MSLEELPDNISVLIVGGSLVGLSAAMFLAARGVPCVVVEKYPGSAPHPRARGFTQRTIEMFDTAGLPVLPQIPADHALRRVRTESMVAKPIEEIAWTPAGSIRAAPVPSAPRSPHTGAAIAQDLLEPFLRKRALELGATLCLGTELVSFEQSDSYVIATVKDSQSNVRTIRAQYLIACDGNQSTIRDSLGIARTGIGVMQVMRSVLFRADLEPYRQGFGQWEIVQPGLDAFLASYGEGRWVLMFRDDIERNDAEAAAAIQRAIGTPVAVELLANGRWELTALIADHFRKGRVFLAGDAAHTLPPTRGGYGANTGIADVFNLSWKLAAVVSDESKESLLDSYEAERKPIAWMRFEQTLARPDYSRFATDAIRAIPLLDPIAVELGELYRSDIILGSNADDVLAKLPEEWGGQPGTRAPHRVVTPNSNSISTLDLFGVGWVLLSSSGAWCDAARQMKERTGVSVNPINLRATLSATDATLVEQDLGIENNGASLVRPDGVIAWRSRDERATVDELVRVMKIVAQTAKSES